MQINLQQAGRFSELHSLPLQLSESDPNPDTGSKQNNKLLTEAHLLNPVLEKVLLLLLESRWKRLTVKQLYFNLHFKAN